MLTIEVVAEANAILISPQKRGWRTAFKVEHEPSNRSEVEKLRERKDDRYTRFYIDAVLVSFLSFFFVSLASHRDVK